MDMFAAPKPVGGNFGAILHYGVSVLSSGFEGLKKTVSTSSVFSGPIVNTDYAYDLVVVGGGIVGLATARETALRYPHMKIALVEKEPRLALHQTGHNSGVIHMGIYYKPGSLKAKLCVEGAELIYKYLDEKKIPYRRCGKVIVAVNDEEIPRLKQIYMRACANKCKDVKMIDREELLKIEPHCTGGKMAVHSPHTGIVDWGEVARSYGKDFREGGGKIITGFEADKFEIAADNKDEVLIHAKSEMVLRSRHVITCCGLQSDRVAHLSGCKQEPKIVPFRGEYLLLNKDKTHMVNGNIYPVPDPKYPFLGVHFTPRMDGSVWLGPNAVLAFSREGYSYSAISFRDLKEMLSYKGLWTLIRKNWRFGSSEMYKSIIIKAQVKHLQKFIPSITAADISRGPAGVRAQAMNAEGGLVEDFVFDQGEKEMGKKMLHVRNAPSPGATSSLAIAKMIADTAGNTFNWNQS